MINKKQIESVKLPNGDVVDCHTMGCYGDKNEKGVCKNFLKCIPMMMKNKGRPIKPQQLKY